MEVSVHVCTRCVEVPAGPWPDELDCYLGENPDDEPIKYFSGIMSVRIVGQSAEATYDFSLFGYGTAAQQLVVYRKTGSDVPIVNHTGRIYSAKMEPLAGMLVQLLMCGMGRAISQLRHFFSGGKVSRRSLEKLPIHEEYHVRIKSASEEGLVRKLLAA